MEGGHFDYSSMYNHQDAHEHRMSTDGMSPALSIAESLPAMMYGFGDEQHPLPETVACMQQLVSEYIGHVTDEACKAAQAKGKLDTDCFVFAVRDDKAKFKRVKQLLDANAHIRACTRLRFVDDGLFTVFHPSFPPRSKVRPVVPLPSLAADPVSESILTPAAAASCGVILTVPAAVEGPEGLGAGEGQAGPGAEGGARAGAAEERGVKVAGEGEGPGAPGEGAGAGEGPPGAGAGAAIGLPSVPPALAASSAPVPATTAAAPDGSSSSIIR